MYKSHLVTIKHVSNSVESKDSDLEVRKLGTVDEVVSYVVSYVLSEIAIYVGEMLLAQDDLTFMRCSKIKWIK